MSTRRLFLRGAPAGPPPPPPAPRGATDMSPRRLFRRGALGGAALSATHAALSAERVRPGSLLGLPEPVLQTTPDTQSPLPPPHRRPYRPVLTLNGWTL